MKQTMAVLRALADESRVRALHALEGGEMCVCQVVELLQLAPSTVSKHLSVLRSAGLVDSRKNGRWMHYRLAKKPPSPAIKRLTRQALDAVGATDTIQKDEKRLVRIRQADLDRLCRKLQVK